MVWIQEQVVRRMLPIGKIPGLQNPSDFCTKNMGVSLMEQYLGQLHVEFAEGRAAVAQQLHLLAQKNVVFASMGDGDPGPGLPG